MARPRFVSFNGEVAPYESATIHIQTPLIRYGAGVFEGIAGYWSEPEQQLYLFRLDDHLRRIQLSMKIMRFAEQPTLSDMQSAVRELLRANAFREDVHLRLLTWIDGDGDMKSTGPIGWSVVAVPRHRSPASEAGLHCQVSSWRRIDEGSMPPRLKSVANYNQGRLAWTQAQLDGYDTVLLQTREGRIAETPMSCMFMVRKGELVTPPITDSILESITRETLLELAHGLELKTCERHIDRTELYIAEEVFLCGSVQEVAPVISVDRHPVGAGLAGPVTLSLKRRYFEVARTGDVRPDWVTPVYPTQSIAKTSDNGE